MKLEEFHFSSDEAGRCPQNSEFATSPAPLPAGESHRQHAGQDRRVPRIDRGPDEAGGATDFNHFQSIGESNGAARTLQKIKDSNGAGLR